MRNPITGLLDILSIRPRRNQSLPHVHGNWWYTLYFPEGLICGDCNTPVVMGKASDTARVYTIKDGKRIPTDWPPPPAREGGAP